MAFNPSNRPGSADHDVFALNREVEALDDRVTVVEQGGGGAGEVFSLQVQAADFAGQGASHTLSMSHTLLPNEIPTKVRAEITAAATGGTLSAVECEIGFAGGFETHIGNIDVFASALPAVPDDYVSTFMQGFTSLAAGNANGNDLQLRFNATGDNLSAVTGLDMTVYVTIETVGS